ncbi:MULTISPECIES: hypothetical protein [Gracilibacillus]|uniref:Uncharacterized protein n=1 Tax=Gracilibacillus dipsosauri TaxID=178340 RepID=A0A317KWB0_9BACI|nr:hypothetical protein [Gracilibacillus dipsosauri]PWU67573.1 hypothetical protein DLJ74_14000 [Gracilibacillus dipsosauri]
MKKVKIIGASLIILMGILVTSGITFASQYHTYSGNVPRFGGNLFTPIHPAMDPKVQQVYLLTVENNAALYATVVDDNKRIHLGQEEVPLAIATWRRVRSNATNLRAIRVMLETRLTNPSTVYTKYRVRW